MHTLKSVQVLIDQTLKKQNFNAKPIELYEPVSYMLSLGGKRMRPALTLLACDLFDGDIKNALMPALGIEIFHNFTLIHDDIMDLAPIRRGKETVYKKWNTNIAILSGDAMFILAYKYLVQTDLSILPEIIEIFNKAALEVCEGQQYDMNFETFQNISIPDYLNMIRLKTAVLLGASLKIGAVLGGAKNQEDKNNIYSFGENIGLAFQLKDDLLDVFSDEKKFGKKTGGDIATNKKTFLYLKAFELAKDKEFDKLKEAFKNKNETKKINSVKNIYQSLNIKKYTEIEMDKFYQKALLHLDLINLPDLKKIELKTLAENLMSREK